MNSTIIPPANISLIFDFHECNPKYLGVIEDNLYISYALPSKIKVYKINKVGEIFNIIYEKTISEDINNNNIEHKCTNNYVVYYSLSNMNTSISIGSLETERKNTFYFPSRGKIYTLNNLPERKDQIAYFTDTNHLVFYQIRENDSIYLEYLNEHFIDVSYVVYNILIKGKNIIVIAKHHEIINVIKYSYDGKELSSILIKEINNGTLKDYKLSDSTVCITDDKLYCQTRNKISSYDLETFNVMNEITFSLSDMSIVYNYNKKPKYIDVDGDWMELHWANKIYFKNLKKDVNNYMLNSEQPIVKYKNHLYQLTNNRMYKYDTPKNLLKNDTWNKRKISLLLMNRIEHQLQNMNLEVVTSCYWFNNKNYKQINAEYKERREYDLVLTRKKKENEKILKNIEMSYNISANGEYVNLTNDIGMIRNYLFVDRDKISKELEVNENLLKKSEENRKIIGQNLHKSEIEYIYCMMSHLPNEIERHIIEWV